MYSLYVLVPLADRCQMTPMKVNDNPNTLTGKGNINKCVAVGDSCIEVASKKKRKKGGGS